MTRVERLERVLQKSFKLRQIFEHYTFSEPRGTRAFKFLYKKIIWTDPIFIISEYLPDSFCYYALRIIKLLKFKVLVLEVYWQTTEGLYCFHHSFYILEPLF